MSTLDEVAATIADADVLIVHKETVPPDVLRAGPSPAADRAPRPDYRGIPIETARELGIPVAATPLVNYLAVAEHTWALILNSIKQLPGQRALMQGRGYGDSWGGFPKHRAGARHDARPAGARRDRQCRSPGSPRRSEMRTIYWDITRFELLEAQYGVEYVAWDELFRRADVVSVHLALNELTQGIIGARRSV